MSPPRALVLRLLLAAACLGPLATPAPAAAGEIPADWSAAQRPFRVFGNTYYVGTRGLAAILVASPAGHILIDGTLPQNAPRIEASIRALGFRLRDVRLILNSHAHFDHAGAIARLARDSGAEVVASAAGARALRLGGEDPADPQYGLAQPFPPVDAVRVVADGETVRLGPLALQAHATPGHTPGSTTWSWTSCEGSRCRAMVYADSLSLLGAGHYRFSDPAHPERLDGFRHALKTIAALPCDILMLPHPDPAELDRRAAGEQSPAVSPCRAYAARGQANLDRVLNEEAHAPTR